ncbi:helix-turn-helix domain-containing protein [Lactobacillus johnsonii]
MNNEQPSYYSITPANVRYDRKLKANEKLLFSEITALANKSGYCTATNGYFAPLYDVTKTTISNWINHLKEKGYVKVVFQKNGKQIIGRKIYPVMNPIKENKNTPVKEKDNTYSRKEQEGIKENFKHPIKEKFKENITSINNTSINNNIRALPDAQAQIPKELTQTQIIEIEFEKLWALYPRKQGKKSALRHYKAWRKADKTHTYELMLSKLTNYLKYRKIKGISLEFTPYGSTWFYSHYDDVLDMTPPKPQFNKSVKPVRKATDWNQYQRQQQPKERRLTQQEREAIFREFGSGGSYAK